MEGGEFRFLVEDMGVTLSSQAGLTTTASQVEISIDFYQQVVQFDEDNVVVDVSGLLSTWWLVSI